MFPDGIVPPSDLSPQTLDELFERLTEVRRTGVAFSGQESTRGVDALSVAVEDAETGEAVALCIVYPAALASAEDRTTIETLLLDGAAEVTGVLGGRTPRKR